MKKLSKFGERLTRKTGILELMDDLGRAMADQSGEMRMLGGGNPAHIPAMQEIFRKRMQDVAAEPKSFARMIGNYTTPQGDSAYLEAVAKLLRKEYGWSVSAKNIAVVNGSQTAFFLLFNMFAGEMENGSKRKILFPVVPEYIGYADQGLSDNFFAANEPKMQMLGEHEFKYGIDFDALRISEDIGAICISRPTNPTGNVITDDEVAHLHRLAKKHDIPLIIDNAYGAPAPNIIFTETNPIWDEHIIHSFSLSKLGLPGVRSSILVASEEVIEKISGINAIVALAGNNIGPALTMPLIESGEIISLTRKIITPYYREKAARAHGYFAKYFDDELPYRVHKTEGALFLWLWCKDLPLSSHELYRKLKARDVLVVPGNYFFPGHTGEWRHKNECLRITYSQDDTAVEEGIKIIGEEVSTAYELASAFPEYGGGIVKAASGRV